jgi:hypothetical protein
MVILLLLEKKIKNIYLQVYRNEKPKGSSILVNEKTSQSTVTQMGGDFIYSQKPSIAISSDSSFVVTWLEHYPYFSYNNSSGLFGKIKFQKFNANGEKIGNIQRADSYELPLSANNGYEGVSKPVIAMDSNNNFVISWEQFRIKYYDTPSGSPLGYQKISSEVRFRMFDSNGFPRDLESINDNSVNIGYDSLEYEPQINMRKDGSFILSYKKSNYFPNKDILNQNYNHAIQYNGGKVEDGIYLKNYSRQGNQISSALEVIKSDITSTQSFISSEISGDDNDFMISWKNRIFATQNLTTTIKSFDIQ